NDHEDNLFSTKQRPSFKQSLFAPALYFELCANRERIRMTQILQQWLKKERKSKGISKLELSNSLSKPDSYVGDVERGVYALDIIEYVYYCQALGSDPKQGIQYISNELENQQK
uniref:helix-turn-helix domain-containing protein n=2 Tax=Moraxellaceae TaxID=468 RepID=UPI003009030B